MRLRRQNNLQQVGPAGFALPATPAHALLNRPPLNTRVLALRSGLQQPSSSTPPLLAKAKVAKLLRCSVYRVDQVLAA